MFAGRDLCELYGTALAHNGRRVGSVWYGFRHDVIADIPART